MFEKILLISGRDKNAIFNSHFFEKFYLLCFAQAGTADVVLRVNALHFFTRWGDMLRTET
jgi:hypothetical protein